MRWRGRFRRGKDAGGYELPKWKECEREEEKIKNFLLKIIRIWSHCGVGKTMRETMQDDGLQGRSLVGEVGLVSFKSVMKKDNGAFFQ